MNLLLAVKVLTASATNQNRAGYLHELDTYRTLNEYVKAEVPGPPLPFLPDLRDNFEISGPHGDHLCFVFVAQSTTVTEFTCSTTSRSLRLHVVQLVLADVVSALEILHSAGLIHTGKF
jgi:hypothetical protein